MTVSVNGLQWDCDDCYGTLSLNGHAMQRLAWCLDMTPFWATPDTRGDNTLIPGLGYVAEPYYRSQTMYSPLLVVNGHWDHLGAEVAAGGDIYAQLRANLAWLIDNVVMVNTALDVTQTALWNPPGAGDVTAEVQVLGIPTPKLAAGAVYRSTLDIRVPGGDLHL